jgi:hypothetical protein
MNRTLDTRRHALSRLTRALVWRWSQMLDGEYVWGSIDIWPSRHGVHRYRLVVFPPGMSVAERRRLRLWRTWPMWGAVLWLVTAICLAGRPTPWPAIGIATVAYLGAGAITLALARNLRSRVRTLHVLVIDGHGDRRSAAAEAHLETLANILRDADAMHIQGRLSEVDHEATCWQVYDHLGSDNPRSLEEHSTL